MILSGLVREQGYKVVLTGEGADEVLGGYDLFKEAPGPPLLARQPDSAARPQLLRRLYPYLKHSPASGGLFAKRSSAKAWSTSAAVVRPRAALERPRPTPVLLEGAGRRGGRWSPSPRSSPAAGGHGRWSPMARDQYVEAHTLMPGYLLSSQGDRMAMAHSVEGRFPFLDHRVIEFANRLPPRYKLMGLTEKYLLKRAHARHLPPATVAR